ncbi:MAG: tetratricopeptide repeat protein [Thiogranum sp.]
MDMQTRSFSRALLLFSIAAVGLAFLAYFPGLAGDYVFDDFPNLLLNQALHLQTLDIDSLLGASLSSDSGALKRPVSMLSFALNYYFFGIEPYSLKVTNLVLHTFNGIGLFILTFLLLDITRSTNKLKLSSKQIPWLAAIVALVWLVHPINLTSVLYIVQRMASLSAFFMIYGLIFYVWYRNRIYRNEGRLYVLISGCVIFLVLATLSKENGVLFPLYLLLTEAFLFRFRNADQQRNTGISIGFSILVIVPLFAVLAWVSVNIDMLGGGHANRGFTIGERVLTEFRVLSTYLRLIVAPSITELGIFHDDIAVSRSLLDPPTTLYAMLFLASLLALAIYTVRRMPLLSFGLLWFFIGHSLESSIILLELMHEHRNYLAGYGIILSTAVVASYIFNSFHHKALAAPVAVVAVLAFASLTFFRASQWDSNINLALSEADHHPNSPRATYSIARIYVKLVLDGGEEKLAPETMQRLETAINVGKQDIKPDVARLIFAGKSGLPIEDEWLARMHRKLTQYPILSDSIGALKTINTCQRQGCAIPQEAIVRLYITALNNKYLKPHSNIHAYIVTAYADFALNNLQDYELGEQLFREAITIRPEDAQYRINYIGLLLETGRLAEAESQLNTLAELNRLGRLSTIIADLRKQLSAAYQAGPEQVNFGSPLSIEPALGYDAP